MAAKRKHRRASRGLMISLCAAAAILLPFALLAIGLADEQLTKNRPVAKFYRAIGIWEPLEELHDGLAGLFEE